MGVRLFDVGKDEHVVSAAKISESDDGGDDGAVAEPTADAE